jgi:molybdopterin molybdotransferase
MRCTVAQVKDGAVPHPRSVEEHRAEVAALLAPTPAENRPLAGCLGLVLAEDVTAPVALPPFDNSAMDGYAVRAADVAGAPVTLPVEADIPAGRTDVPALRPGTAHRIMTGAPLPAGADAVVQVELTDAGTTTVEIRAAVAAGTHLRMAGEDVAKGSVVLTAGSVLGPARLGLAAAIGAASLPVRRPPRVLVLSTGSELVEPGNPLLPGQIYESNSVLLAAAITEAGAEATVLRFVPDDVDEFLAAVASRADGVDLLITSGGVSAGAFEVVKDALAGRGVDFLKVAMQPGGPQGLGRLDGLPVVALPGNPVSTALSFELFVRPALRAAMGHPAVDRPRARARLVSALRSPAGRRQYRRGRFEAGTVEVTPVGGPGSHLLASFAASNCLIEVPDEATEVRAGDEVSVILL